MSFKDKVVIVTGGGQGIGEAYAKAFAKEGMKVAVAEINEEGGQRVVNEIKAAGGDALFVKTDVSSEASCLAMAKAVADAFGGIDYLLNNAAIFGNMKIQGYLDVDLAYLDKFMAVNANGCLLTTRAVVPYMVKRGGGSIVNQSSTAAWMNMGYYGVAKLAMNGITGSLARELGPRNIRINAIAPGPTDTQALRTQAGDYAKELVKTMPIARLGQPEDMVGPVLFLFSEQSAWVTGHVLNVDGGQWMRV